MIGVPSVGRHLYPKVQVHRVKHRPKEHGVTEFHLHYSLPFGRVVVDLNALPLPIAAHSQVRTLYMIQDQWIWKIFWLGE